MNTSDIVKTLLQLGVTVKDTISKSQSGGSIDWSKAARDVIENKQVSQTLSDLVTVVRGSDLQRSLAEIDSKQTALLNGRSVQQLPHNELLQYSDLADARLLLATQQLTKSLDGGALQWLVSEALPTLKDIAPVVIPLLL